MRKVGVMLPKKRHPDSYDQHTLLDAPSIAEMEPLKKDARKFLSRFEKRGYNVDDFIEMLGLDDVAI